MKPPRRCCVEPTSKDRAMAFGLSPTSVAACLLLAALQTGVPVTEEPRHRVVFTNGYVRVIDASLPVGDVTLFHTHDLDNRQLSSREERFAPTSSTGPRATPRSKSVVRGSRRPPTHTKSPTSARRRSASSTPRSLRGGNRPVLERRSPARRPRSSKTTSCASRGSHSSRTPASRRMSIRGLCCTWRSPGAVVPGCPAPRAASGGSIPARRTEWRTRATGGMKA